jgi:hypothetical protein
MGCGILLRLSTGVPLIDKHHFGRFTRDGVHLFRQQLHLCPILLMRRPNIQDQQMAQGVDHHVCLVPARTFRAVITRPCASLQDELRGAAIRNSHPGLPCTTLAQPQHEALVTHDSLKDTGVQSTVRLLIDRSHGGRSFGIGRHGAHARASGGHSP